MEGGSTPNGDWPSFVRKVPTAILKGVIDMKSLDYVLVHAETAFLFNCFLARISKKHYLSYYNDSIRLWDAEDFHHELKCLYETYLDRKLPSSRKIEVRSVTPSQKTCIKNFVVNPEQSSLTEVKDAIIKLQEGVYNYLEDIVKRSFTDELLKFI